MSKITIFLHWRIQKWDINFYQWHFMITLIFTVLYFLKMQPNFDVQYQIEPKRWNIFMAVFMDLFPCLFTAKLSYTQLFKWGHSKGRAGSHGHWPPQFAFCYSTQQLLKVFFFRKCDSNLQTSKKIFLKTIRALKFKYQV